MKHQSKRGLLSIPKLVTGIWTVTVFLLISASINAGELSQSLTFSPSDLRFSTANGYNIVVIGNGPTITDTTKLGFPAVPYKQVMLVLPTKTKIDSIIVTSSSSQGISGSYNLFPIQHNIYHNLSTPPPFVPPDSAAYSSNTPFPGKLVEVVHEGYMRQFHLVQVKVYPVQYVAAQKRLLLYTNIAFSIYYSGGGLEPLGETGGTLPAEDLKGNEEAIKKMVQNKDDVQKFETKTPVPSSRKVRKFGVTSLPSLEGERPQYVIITNNYRIDGTYIGEMVNEFQRLADWKTQKGCPTVVRTVSWIRDNYPGCDVQEQIRHFVQEAYQYWQIDWVLLGGSTEIIPCRYAGWGQRPTDLYYSDLQGNWDADHDGIFEGGDWHPEVWVGRAPVHSQAEATVFTNKTFTYERNSLVPLPPPDYLGKYLTLGGFIHVAYGWNWFVGIYLMEQIRLYNIIPPSLYHYRIYEWDGVHFPNEYQRTQEDLSRVAAKYSIDQGYGIINHADHGQPYLIEMGSWTNGGSFVRTTMDALANGNQYGIFYSAACSPAAMDFNSIGERYVLAQGRGGAAFIGCSRSVSTYSANNHDYLFFETLFSQGIYHIGETLGRTFFDVEAASLFTLFGDPELSVWSDRPHPMYVQHPTNIPMGPQQFMVTVYDATLPPPLPPLQDALVCLKKGTNLDQGLEAYAYGKTDQNGQITFDYQPETSGEMKVTVTTHNFTPYEGTCAVGQGSLAPYVFPAVAGRSYIDSPGGNGDGKPNPGETMSMMVALTNSGNLDANSVHAEISTLDNWVWITKSGSDYGTILKDQTVINTADPFTIGVSNFCPDVHDARFDITITASGGYQWTDHFTVTVLADSLKFVGHSRGGDTPGQSYTLNDLAITNRGSGAGAGVIATLEGDPQYVRIDDGNSYFGPINGNSTVVSTDPFTYYVIQLPPPPDPLSLTVRMRDVYGGREWTKAFEVNGPNPPSAPTLTPYPGNINLRWTPPSNQDVLGYHVYRGNNPGGPYERINASLIEGTATYLDKGLAPNTTYYYVVTSVDTSLNESDYSQPEAHGCCNPTIRSGWPQWIGGDGVTYCSPVVGDINGDGFKELVIGGADDSLHAWTAEGSPLPNWPIYMGQDITLSPALGDMDGDGIPDVVVSVGNVVKAYNGSGGLIRTWPATTEAISTSPTLADMDLDGQLEIIVGTGTWTGTGCHVYIWKQNGNALAGWPVSAYSVRGIAVGNVITNTSQPELFATGAAITSSWVARLYGWSYDGQPLTGWDPPKEWQGAHIGGRPALGDVDSDGHLDVVGYEYNSSTTEKFFVSVWDGDGNRIWTSNLYSIGTPVGPAWNSVALGDFQKGGYLDVLVARYSGAMFAFNYQGQPLPGWYKSIPSNMYVSPVMANALGVSAREAFVQLYDHSIYGFNVDGSTPSGWPLQETGLCNVTPCITDLDNDGKTEMIGASGDGWVYVWKLETPFDREHLEWGMEGHDVRRTYLYSQPISGTLPGNTTWRGNIEMTGDVTVPQGVTLTIESGTVIKVRPFFWGFRLNVYGTLNAVGTALDSIYFTSANVNPQANDWFGIDVQDGGVANLQYCAVRYGYNNITAESGSNVTVTHCRTTKASAAGVVLFNGAAHTVSDCDISDNGVYGINLWGPWNGGSTVMIERNTLSQNGYYGIYAYDLALGDFQVNSNTISYQMWEPPNPSQWGIYCEGVSNGTSLFANNISGYGQGGIQLYNSAAKCTCNTVSNTWNGLYFWESPSIVTHNFVGVGVGIGAWVDGFFAVPNLGDKTNVIETDDGLNSIIGDSYHGVNYFLPQVMAENNWWGNYPPDPPDPNKFIGLWDYDPWLLASPIPCGGPPGGGPQMGELLEQQLPRVFALAQSRPNPSSGEMVIHYQMPKACDVSMKLYNVSGQLVKTLVKGPQKAGYYAVSWKGKDEAGHAVRSGVYFYKMEAGEFKSIRKLVIVR